jgi:hypothetical protein
MKVNYKIEKSEFHKKPLYIYVCHYNYQNLIFLYNQIDSNKIYSYGVGRWIIKYKK